MAETKSTFAVKVGLAQMLKGGVIMDVVNEEQARIAEEAGAVAGAHTRRALPCATATPRRNAPPWRRCTCGVARCGACALRVVVPRAVRGT